MEVSQKMKHGNYHSIQQSCRKRIYLLTSGCDTRILQRHLHPYAHSAQFTRAKTQTQAKRAVTDERISSMWYVHAVERYT